MNMKSKLAERASSGAANAMGLEERLRLANEAATGTHPLAPLQGPAHGGATGPANVQLHEQPSKPAAAAGASDGGADAASEPPDDPNRAYFKSVEMELIDENPFNARKSYKQSRILEMAASLAKNGQDTPGKATIRNGRYVLAAGHYRRFGLQHINAPRMDLMVKPNMTDQELYEASYRENAEREDQTAYDDALSWQQLLKDHVYENETALHQAIGVSLSTVNKTLALFRLSAEMLAVVAAAPEKFPLSTLYELILLEEVVGTERALQAAALVQEGKLTRDQVKEIRDQVSQPKIRKRKETSRPYEIRVGTFQGTLKEFPNGKVTLEVNIADVSTRETFVAELREKFGPKSQA